MHLVALSFAILAVSCGGVAPPLAHSHPSARDLAAAVLNALERRDAEALRALALNEEEFRDYVWPELPAARPERNLPLSYVWGDLRQKSEAGLAQTLETKGGRRYDLGEVRFAGETTRYKTFRVHRRTVLMVRDAQGAQQQLEIFGSVLERDGRWKVFSYVVD